MLRGYFINFFVMWNIASATSMKIKRKNMKAAHIKDYELLGTAC